VTLAIIGFGCSATGNDKLGRESVPVNRLDDLWDFQNPAASEERFRAFLESSQDAAFRAEVLTQVARAEGLQGKFDEANATLDRAETLAPEDASAVRVRLQLERGRVLNSAGKPAESRSYFIDALALAEDSGEDHYAVDAAHMLGIVDPPSEQIAWSEKALKIARASKDPRAQRWLGPLYNNLGWSYHDTGHYERALELFESALSWYRANGNAKQIHVARWSVARAKRSLNQTEAALEMQQELLKDLDAIGETDGYVYEELAECLVVLGREDDAKKYFARAHRELSQDEWLVKTETARIERLKALGENAGEQRRE
jgi:tetratricopeptide (TPR) repeat protein